MFDPIRIATFLCNVPYHKTTTSMRGNARLVYWQEGRLFYFGLLLEAFLPRLIIRWYLGVFTLIYLIWKNSY